MLRRNAATVAVLTAAVLALPGIAEANYSATGGGSADISAATMRNGTGLTPTCGSGSVKGVVLNWTASLDTFVVSYTVRRSINNAAFSVLASGVTATTYNDATAQNANPGDSYAYTISAVVQNWVTPQSASVSKSFSTVNGKCV